MFKIQIAAANVNLVVVIEIVVVIVVVVDSFKRHLNYFGWTNCFYLFG